MLSWEDWVQPLRRLEHQHSLRELSLVGAGLLVYFLIRGSVVNEMQQAIAHGRAIIAFERWLGIYWETELQRTLGANLVEIQGWNLVYFWAHAPVIAAAGIWLYRRHRPLYSLIRNAFLVSAMVGLCLYYLYPVAPPRLMPGTGFVDTMQRYSSLSYQAESLKPFVNPYAAVPSLHFGWSFLIGVGLILAGRNAIGWTAGLLLPILMLVAIIVTGNHFIVDALSGLAVCLLGLLCALLLHRRHAPQAFRIVLPVRRVDVPCAAPLSDPSSAD